MAANDAITVRLRLQDAKRFQAEAAAAATSVEGIGKRGGKGVADLSTRLETMSGRMHKAGRAATMGLTLPIAAVGFAAYKAFDAVDAGIDAITTGTGASGAALAGLHDSFRAVAGTVNQDMAITGQAIADLNTRLGLTGKPLENMSRQFLELSRITETDVGENIRAVTRAFGDWEVKTGDQAGQLDKFFVASQKSGASVSELAAQVVQFGAPLRQVGFSLDEATAMFASFEKAGVNTSTMMPGIKQAMKTFFEKGIDPRKGLTEAFAGIEDGSIKADEAIKIFGVRAGGDMIEAVEQGRFKLDDLTKALQGNGGAVMKTAEQTLDGSDKLARGMNQAKLAIAPLGEAISGGLGVALEGVAPILAKLGEWLGGMSPKTRAVVLGVLAFAATLGPLLRLMGWWFGGLSKLATAYKWLAATQIGQRVATIAGAVATGVMTAAQWALNVAMRANPIGLLLTGLTLLAAGFMWAYKKVGWFRSGVQAVWGWLKTNWPKILAILTGPVGLAVLFIVKKWDRIKSAASSVVGFVKARFNDVVGFFRGLPGRISRAASGLWNGIKDAFRSALNWIIAKWNSFELGFGPVKIPGPVPDIPRMAIATPNIPMLAQGGTVVSPGWAMVGDEGPELLRLDRGAEVQPLPAGAGAFMAPGAAATGGRDLRIENVIMVGERELARVVGKVTADQLARR